MESIDQSAMTNAPLERPLFVCMTHIVLRKSYIALVIPRYQSQREDHTLVSTIHTLLERPCIGFNNSNSAAEDGPSVWMAHRVLGRPCTSLNNPQINLNDSDTTLGEIFTDQKMQHSSF